MITWVITHGSKTWKPWKQFKQCKPDTHVCSHESWKYLVEKTLKQWKQSEQTFKPSSAPMVVKELRKNKNKGCKVPC